MKKILALVVLVFICSNIFAGSSYWLRGDDFTNFIDGKKSNFMSSSKPNISASETIFETDLNGIIGEWYTSSLSSGIQINGNIYLWTNGITSENTVIKWELYDYSSQSNSSKLIAQSQFISGQEESYVVLEKAVTIESGHRLKLVLKSEENAKLSVDYSDVSSKSEWIAPNDEVFEAIGIKYTGILFFEKCSLDEISCKNDASCNDQNPFTKDICNEPNTCSSSCNYTKCDPLCTTYADCADNIPSTIDKCERIGTCDAFCSNKDCEIKCINDSKCSEENPACIYPGTCFSKCEKADYTAKFSSCIETKCTKGLCTEEPMPNCCGNNICENNETALTCSTDCSGNSLEVLMPSNADYAFIGEKVKLKILAEKTSLVHAKGFFGEIELYDDGQHNDNSKNDGVFGNTIIPEAKHEGLQKIIISSAGKEKTINLNIIPMLEIEISATEQEYIISDLLEITGNVSRKGEPINDKLKIEAKAGNRVIFSEWISSDVFGNFYYSYKSFSADSSGEWTISAYTDDEKGNKGYAEEKIYFYEPEQDLPLKIIVIEKPEEKLSPDANFTIKVSVLQNRKVTNIANVTAEIGGKKLTFSEENGVYILKTSINEIYSGENKLKILAEIGELKGRSTINLEVEPFPLEIKIIEPTKNSFGVGEKVKFKINVSKNNSVITDVELTLKINNENIEIFREGDYFSGNYTVKEGNFISVDAEAIDEFGGVGKTQFSGVISGYSYDYYFDKYGNIMLGGTILLLALFTIFGYFLMTCHTKDCLEKKDKEFIEKIKNIQTRYFKEGSLSRKKYDELMIKYEQELSKIRGELKKN